MQNKFKILCILFSVTLFIGTESKAQTCGFGCLGLSGVYAGYSIHSNEFKVDNFYLEQSDLKFSKISGFRFGVNLFRANFDKYLVSLKGFYQFSNQKLDFEAIEVGAIYEKDFELSFNYYGFALDFGVPVFDFLDLKIIEAGLNFYNSSFKTTESINNVVVSEEKYEGGSIDMGYFVGSGFVFHLIKNYVSIEGTVFYNKINIGSMVNEGGVYLFDKKTDLINNGNIAGTLQLNIGLPF